MTNITNKMNAREYLLSHISKDAISLFGTSSPQFLDKVTDLWMDDKHEPLLRLDEIRTFLPESNKVLDMASGCGTFVFGALLHGFDAYGIEPEHWKNTLCQLKITDHKYNDNYRGRFIESVGETLSFNDNTFDCVSSYQTLEHVQDIERCIDEMLRVCRSNGGLHLRCPDYMSLYEGHYRLPWLPFMPHLLARIYLKLMRRPLAGLDTLHYTSKWQIIRILKKCAKKRGITLTIIDINKKRALDKLIKLRLPRILLAIYPILRAFAFIWYAFRSDLSIALIVKLQKP